MYEQDIPADFGPRVLQSLQFQYVQLLYGLLDLGFVTHHDLHILLQFSLLLLDTGHKCQHHQKNISRHEGKRTYRSCS